MAESRKKAKAVRKSTKRPASTKRQPSAKRQSTKRRTSAKRRTSTKRRSSAKGRTSTKRRTSTKCQSSAKSQSPKPKSPTKGQSTPKMETSQEEAQKPKGVKRVHGSISVKTESKTAPEGDKIETSKSEYFETTSPGSNGSASASGIDPYAFASSLFPSMTDGDGLQWPSMFSANRNLGFQMNSVFQDPFTAALSTMSLDPFSSGWSPMRTDPFASTSFPRRSNPFGPSFFNNPNINAGLLAAAERRLRNPLMATSPGFGLSNGFGNFNLTKVCPLANLVSLLPVLPSGEFQCLKDLQQAMDPTPQLMEAFSKMNGASGSGLEFPNMSKPSCHCKNPGSCGLHCTCNGPVASTSANASGYIVRNDGFFSDTVPANTETVRPAMACEGGKPTPVSKAMTPEPSSKDKSDSTPSSRERRKSSCGGKCNLAARNRKKSKKRRSTRRTKSTSQSRRRRRRSRSASSRRNRRPSTGGRRRRSRRSSSRSSTRDRRSRRTQSTRRRRSKASNKSKRNRSSKK